MGGEPIIPIEVIVPSYRVAHHDPTNNGKERIDDLDLADKRREVVVVRLEAMKKQVARYYVKKMRPHAIVARARFSSVVFDQTPRKESWRQSGKFHIVFARSWALARSSWSISMARR
ncbi:unnamed protein product [Linum trigynum]|uniref:Uncharacterized protein n=1 Tax=Linum trigynum TaxID=586398 RepID=A0AAV2EPC6_9ROSI